MMKVDSKSYFTTIFGVRSIPETYVCHSWYTFTRSRIDVANKTKQNACVLQQRHNLQIQSSTKHTTPWIGIEKLWATVCTTAAWRTIHGTTLTFTRTHIPLLCSYLTTEQRSGWSMVLVEWHPDICRKDLPNARTATLGSTSPGEDPGVAVAFVLVQLTTGLMFCRAIAAATTTVCTTTARRLCGN